MSQAAINTNHHRLPASPGQNRNLRRAGLLFLLMVLCALFIGGRMILRWMQDPQRLPISQLIVTGERRYTHDDDIRQAILSLGTPGTFMTQDVNTIQRQIKRLPWIKQASVRKQWPNELKIHLEEYRPAAYWDTHNLIDNQGNIFSVPAERMTRQEQPLISLSGPADSQLLVLQQAREMSQALAQARFTLRAAAMTARYSWQVTLENGITLDLGRGDRMQRLQRFITLYPLLQQQEQQTDKQIHYVDLRYDAGAAVGWTVTANNNQLQAEQ